MGQFKPNKYKLELQLNSDFKKFDETLRMVLDCSEIQVQQIQIFLEELHAKHLIVFGIHLSENALMTCVVQSPTNNKHVHFIDGADGGYAIAALRLKDQLKTREALRQSA